MSNVVEFSYERMNHKAVNKFIESLAQSLRTALLDDKLIAHAFAFLQQEGWDAINFLAAKYNRDEKGRFLVSFFSTLRENESDEFLTIRIGRGVRSINEAYKIVPSDRWSQVESLTEACIKGQENLVNPFAGLTLGLLGAIDHGYESYMAQEGDKFHVIAQRPTDSQTYFITIDRAVAQHDHNYLQTVKEQ